MNRMLIMTFKNTEALSLETCKEALGDKRLSVRFFLVYSRDRLEQEE